MEEDINLINKVKESGDSEYLQELINRHSGIYVDMVNRYIPSDIEGVDKQDILEDKDFCIYNAALSFDEDKNTKFSTYLGNLARWRCLNIYNKIKKFPMQSIDDEKTTNISCDSGIKEVEKEESLNKINQLIQKSKDPRVRKIFSMRYYSGRKTQPWKNIAKELDLSIQGCINIHNVYLEKIKKSL